MARIPGIGKAKKDRLIGGETWTVQWVIPGKETAVGLKKGQRIRLEERFGANNASLFPDSDTDLFKENDEIKLKVVRKDDELGFVFEADITLSGASKTIYIQEGSAQPDTDAEIYEADPRETVGLPGGIVGIRR